MIKFLNCMYFVIELLIINVLWILHCIKYHKFVTLALGLETNIRFIRLIKYIMWIKSLISISYLAQCFAVYFLALLKYFRQRNHYWFTYVYPNSIKLTFCRIVLWDNNEKKQNCRVENPLSFNVRVFQKICQIFSFLSISNVEFQ